jgi:5'-nucleotidase
MIILDPEKIQVNTPKPEKLVMFDMDGTLADYEGQMRKDLKAMQSHLEPDSVFQTLQGDIPEWLEARMSRIKNTPGWWRNLPRLQDGFSILHLAIKIGFTPGILTKGPVKTTQAWEEKFIWCKENIVDPGYTDGIVPNITITMDKGLTYATVLVEDHPPYVQRWLTWRPRGLVVLLDRPYNVGFEHSQVVRYDGGISSFSLVNKRMLEAFHRSHGV